MFFLFFGLIILEIGTLKLPFSEKESLKPNDYFNELDNENKRLTEYLRVYYNDLAKKSPENTKKLNDIVSILKKALETKAEKRPDFVELFCEMHRVEGNDSRDSAFILRKLLEIDKKLSSSDIEEEGQQICIIFHLNIFHKHFRLRSRNFDGRQKLQYEKLFAFFDQWR